VSPAYSLRRARDGDWLALYRLHREAMGPHIVATWGPWDEQQQWRFFLSRIVGRRLQVIESGGATAGILELSDRPESVHVDNIELAAAYRGRGLGGAILRDIQRDAAARGLDVELRVLHVNPAKRLYERLGFVQTDATETHTLMRWSRRTAATPAEGQAPASQ
jgi:ribosomal protein S18 acetylase RimI-like enzyme